MTSADARTKIEKAVGHLRFPLSIEVDAYGQVTDVRYETSWQEGDVETIVDKNNRVVYKQNYQERSLTEKQIADLEECIKSIL